MASGVNLKKICYSEHSKLINLKNYTEGILKKTLTDSIRIHRKGKYVQYSLISVDRGGLRRENSIRKKDLENYKDQIDLFCAKKVKPVVKKLISALEKDIASYDDAALEQVFQKLCELFGDLVPEKYWSNKMLMSKWQETPYPRLDYKTDKLIFTTLRGDKVRSKVEVMVADILYNMNIPYRYDARLVKGGVTFWPDFTMISPVSGKVTYLEVFGMMTDKKYAADNMKKINSYHKAGIIQGDRLIMVFDSEDTPFDSDAFVKTVKTVVLNES